MLYNKPFERRDEARIFRDTLLDDTRIRLLELSGLWICEANPVDEKMAVGEVLQKNDGETLPVSEEKPYSLKVRSYKEEHPAIQNSERLRENNINAYIVKTYDDNAYFSFDVHAGAFAKPIIRIFATIQMHITIDKFIAKRLITALIRSRIIAAYRNKFFIDKLITTISKNFILQDIGFCGSRRNIFY